MDALKTAATLAGMVDSHTMQDPHLDRPASVSTVITAGQFEGMTISRASHGIDVSKDRKRETPNRLKMQGRRYYGGEPAPPSYADAKCHFDLRTPDSANPWNDPRGQCMR